MMQIVFASVNFNGCLMMCGGEWQLKRVVFYRIYLRKMSKKKVCFWIFCFVVAGANRPVMNYPVSQQRTLQFWICISLEGICCFLVVLIIRSLLPAMGAWGTRGTKKDSPWCTCWKLLKIKRFSFWLSEQYSFIKENTDAAYLAWETHRPFVLSRQRWDASLPCGRNCCESSFHVNSIFE